MNDTDKRHRRADHHRRFPAFGRGLAEGLDSYRGHSRGWRSGYCRFSYIRTDSPSAGDHRGPGDNAQRRSLSPSADAKSARIELGAGGHLLCRADAVAFDRYSRDEQLALVGLFAAVSGSDRLPPGDSDGLFHDCHRAISDRQPPAGADADYRLSHSGKRHLRLRRLLRPVGIDADRNRHPAGCLRRRCSSWASWSSISAASSTISRPAN